MRYQEHLPRALRGVSLQTRAGEKVGVVGRTGSGKSSLFQCLFRLTEIEAGEVHIDNVNIKLLDLEELRGQLVIIPQQPFLFRWENINLSRCIAMDGWMTYLTSYFSGTVKENLDPVGFYSQRQIADVVKRCKLESLVTRLGGMS